MSVKQPTAAEMDANLLRDANLACANLLAVSAILAAPQPTLRERRYLREAARYDRAIQAILRAARIADDSRRKLDRWDRENLRRPNGTMTGEEAVEAIGGGDLVLAARASVGRN